MQAEVITLSGKRTFTLESARKLLPVVRRLTANAMDETDRLIQQAELLDKESEARENLEKQINAHIEVWVRKIERLGCEVKGLWLVDFDSGSGYYCWQFGDSDIAFFHGYAEGFSGRRPLSAHHSKVT